MTKRILIALAVLAALVAFLLVKIGPGKTGPPTEIAAEGREGKLARSVTARQLTILFGGSSWWNVIGHAAEPDRAACLVHNPLQVDRTGRATTATYLLDRRIDFRLATYVFATRQAALTAMAAAGTRRLEECRAGEFARYLRDGGYVPASARGYASHQLASGRIARSSHILVPSTYKKRPYTWNLDSTYVLQGRIITVLGTIAGGPFQQYNERLAQLLNTKTPRS